jgi:ketosteroid isomerase-like protein
MRDITSLEQRIRRLEARVDIDELIARYALVMDNRDVAALPELFTADVVVESSRGGMHAVGRDAVVELFLARFRVLGPSNHVTHDRIVTFDAADPNHARGLVLSHAEMRVSGESMVAALRYVDAYRRDNGRWQFASRRLHFMYYSRTAAYPAAFAAPRGAGKPVEDAAIARDWSEQVAMWRGAYGDWPAQR